MALQNGPVVFQVVNDAFVPGCRINAIIWVSPGSTAGDRVVLSQRTTNETIWECVTDSTNTYLGGNLGEIGVPAQNGFYVSRLDSGKLLIYLREQ